MRKIVFTVLMMFFSVFASLAQDVSGWSGSGTASNPYQLATRADLELLATRVNAYNVSNGGTEASPMYRAYKGLYFKLTGDIDLLDSVFEPIGNSYNHAFAGTLDGGGYTIKRLNVSRKGYAGLFGNVDTVGVVKNLTLDNATVVSESYFAGIVAGLCKGTLQDVHVAGSRVGCYTAAVGGLGGSLGTVKNCSVENTTVIGLSGFVGAIAGEIEHGSMETTWATGCTVDGGGTQGMPVGGLVGNLFNSTAVGCYFTGTVDGTYAVNGNRSTNLLVGGLFGRATVSMVNRCFAKALVKGLYGQAHVGGLVGEMLGGYLRYSYATGHVDCAASPYVGGLTGYVNLFKSGSTVYQPEVLSCYTAGTINCSTYQYDTSTGMRELFGTVDTAATLTATSVYYDNQMADLGSQQHGVSTATLTSASGPEGFPAAYWSLAVGSYPRVKGLQDTEAACYSASAIHFYGVNSLGNVARNAGLTALGNTKFELKHGGTCCTLTPDSLVLNGTFGTDTLLMLNGVDTMEYALKIAPVAFEGEGTQASPYLLKTKADMVALSRITTDEQVFFPGTYFKIVNDIDMEHSADFKGICNLPNDVNARFAGVLDGDGHTLHNLALTSYVKWKTEPTSHFGDGTGTPLTGTGGCTLYGGIVGRLETTGVVKNLTVASDATIQFFASSGTFVGDNYGTVENCRNYAEVTGLSNWIGGIVGRNNKGGTVKDCFNAGNVSSGYQNVGGIVGNCAGTVDNCMNTGSVTSRQLSLLNTRSHMYAGGIVGQASGMVMRNCLNTGTVTAVKSNAGGLAGSLGKSSSGDGNNDIYTSMSYGTVYSGDPALVGGLGGSTGTQGKISACWDAQIAPLKASANADLDGALGLLTQQLTSGTALEGYDSSVWDFAAGSYPTLKTFAAEATAAASRQVIVSIDAQQNAMALASDATLAAPQGTTWALAQGTAFSIDGSTLKVPVKPAAVALDTLVATAGAYVKTIALLTPYELALNGAGTQASPYLIANARDWNAVARYMADCKTDLAGKYLKVMNDIDFTDSTLVSMGYDKVNYLQGDLDGAGHTIRGFKFSPTATAQGVIAVVGNKAVVHDLTIEGAVQTTQTYTGGFAGTVLGKMQRCVNKIAVTSTRTGVGGFAAYVGATAQLEDCYNRAPVTGASGTVGGFAASVLEGASIVRCGNEGKVTNQGTQSYTGGFTALSLPATYTSVYNTGDVVNEKSTSSTYAAGLIGSASSGKSHYVLKGCYNTGSVTAKGNLAGLVAGGSSSRYVMVMDSCYNTGAITSASTGSTSSAPTAGLQSYYSSGSSYTHCWNTGAITSEKNMYVAGLLGMRTSNGSSASDAVTIDNCYNTGSIVAGKGTAAGITTTTNGYTVITHCYNAGNISGLDALGGIVSLMSGGNDTIAHCWNEGNITAAVCRAGGIQAYGMATGAITHCFNVGDIATTSTEKGTSVAKSGFCIGGLAGASGAVFTACYNAGKVTGASQVGGLVGVPYPSRTAFYNCYNAGELVADADTCGAIIGVNPANSKVWDDGNVASSVYYTTDYGTYGNVVGTGLSMRNLCTADLGGDFKSLGDYMLPVLVEHGSLQPAVFYAAAVCVQDGDTYSTVTGNFNVGAPAGLVWTPSVTDVAVDGNRATFASTYNGEVVMTATWGPYTKQVKLSCTNATGVASVTGSPAATVVGRYNLQGQPVDAGCQGVQLVRYSDGTTRKVIVK